ncbi:PLD nuclease N-terminal domain-containing protein [Cellulomonas biazotea]|uniref:Cardiolipin synthase N-terminal domain-containing protein n=1 Tax=Cellulomonas biazotea TaxID=1709 RepID=A0A402DSU4_9CELL|nr:PLD nuclease N-terminal domain-containing protein [Cellulomonas biazotea]GCE77181.1 hypothetical protein CBZ_22370 [Cellulomonas biazotea]
MIRYLPFVVEIGLLVYCLIDCVQSDEGRVRNLPKVGWIVLIILLPIVGGIAWLVAGRPQGTRRDVPWPSTATAGFPEYERPRRGAPDDDPEFLAGMRRSDAQHEQMLKDWEAQLREREQRLDEPGTDPAGGRPTV